jgi:hypothetical protein
MHFSEWQQIRELSMRQKDIHGQDAAFLTSLQEKERYQELTVKESDDLAVQRYPSHISWNFHDLRYNAVAGMSGMEPG